MKDYFPLITPFLSALIAAIVGCITSQVAIRKEKKTMDNKREEMLCEGMKILMRQQLIEIEEKYHKNGYVPIATKQTAQETHAVYKGLGGNHLGDTIYTEIMAAPDHKPSNKDK